MTTSGVIKRVALTTVICGAAWASTRIDAPAPSSVRAFRGLYALDATPLGNLALPISLFALAFGVTEALAVLVPRLRALRLDGGPGRLVLRRMAYAFVALQLVVWSVAMTRMADSIGASSEADALAFAAWQISLVVASTIAVALAAHVIDSHGVGSGFGALLVVSQLGEPYLELWIKRGPTFDLWMPCSLMLGAAVALHLGERWPNARATLWPIPACSIFAITLTTAWANHQLSSGFLLPLPVFAACALVSGLVLSLFTARLPPHMRGDREWVGRQRATLAYSLAFVAATSVLNVWLSTHLLPWDPSPVDANGWPTAPLRLPFYIFCAAFLLDVVHEVRGRRELGALDDAWQDSRGWALPVALAALQREGVPFVLRGGRVHALVQVFGPHMAFRVAVRPEDRAQAHELIEEAVNG